MEPTSLVSTGDLFFSIKEVTYTPEAPLMNEPFTVRGKVDLFHIPLLVPVWIIATVVYPETWWEEITPLLGSPEVRSSDVALGGDFEIKFPDGFQREGEFGLSVRVYVGPTFPLDSIVLPPAPAAATYETTFVVAGEMPPQEELFQDFQIESYSKDGDTPVSSPNVLELKAGDRCRVNLSYNHKGPAVTGKFHAAIWHHSIIDPHDEILYKEQSFSVPQSEDWTNYKQSVDIIITSAISPGSDYGLYAKIIGITGGDVFTDFLADVITITGAGEPQITDLQIIDYDSPVEAGDKCNVKVSFTYQGPAVNKTLYAAVGNYGTFGFDEILAGSKNISLPLSESPAAFESTVPITITTAIDPTESPYDVYAKIDSTISPVLQGVIEVTGAPAEEGFRNLQITDYDTPVEAGDQCKVSVSFEYKGPAVSKTLYAAIGTDGTFGFDEILYGQRTVSIPKSDDWTTYESYVNISITTAIDPAGSPYDLYAKITGVIESTHLQNVITVTGAPATPEFSNLQITGYDTPVEAGDSCKVKVSFDYRGPAISKTAYAAIGNDGTFGFDEILHGSTTVSLPATANKKSYTATISISITTAIDPAGSPYDLYAKITGVIESSHLQNVITVTGAPSTPTITNFRITNYETPVSIGGSCKITVAFTYSGPAVSKRLYAAIGNDGTFGFDEILAGSTYISIPAASTPTSRTAQVSISITSAIDPAGSPYDVYAKLDSIQASPVLNVITVKKLTVSFKVKVKNYALVMPGATQWACQYYDPVTKSWVDSGFHSLSATASFNDVHAGGQLGALLYDGTNLTDWIYSPYFTAVDGKTYQFDVKNKTVTQV